MSSGQAAAALRRGGLIMAALLAAGRVDAHKAITSPYTYNQDVFPILNERCGACHVDGGVAPMSLLTYKDAVPWAESMRIELLSAHMPPDGSRLSARELDVLLTWATGGTPQGLARQLPDVAPRKQWRAGPPDLAVQMPAAFTLPAGTAEETHDFLLQRGSREDRWVTRVDVLPGTPAIVRHALIYTRGPDDDTPQTVLGVWVPGREALGTPPGAAYRWAAGTDLVARMHYRRTWKYEGVPLADRSTVGLYFAVHPPARELQSIKVTAPFTLASRTLDVVGVRPEAVSRADFEIRVDARRTDGKRVGIFARTIQPGWERRYWLRRPVLVPAGSRITVAAVAAQTAGDGPAGAARGAPDDAAPPGTAPAVWLEIARTVRP